MWLLVDVQQLQKIVNKLTVLINTIFSNSSITQHLWSRNVSLLLSSHIFDVKVVFVCLCVRVVVVVVCVGGVVPREGGDMRDE